MDIKIFEGITRKVNILLYIFIPIQRARHISYALFSLQIVPIFVGLAFIGWIVFVAGFGKYNEA